MMTPRTRFLDTLGGKKADRVPLMLDGFMLAKREDAEQIKDPGTREIAERAFEHTVVLVGFNSHINRYLATPPQYIRNLSREEAADGTVTTTTAIDTPKGELTAVVSQNPMTHTAWTTKYPVESLADIDKIRSVPWQLPKGLERPDGSTLPDLEDRCVIRGSVSSPFVCVAGMMSYQYFLELCSTELALMKELTELCKDRILSVLDVLLADRLIEYVWMGGCEWVTPPMASPRVYEELVQGPEAEVIARIHEGGAFCHVHCHGNVRSTLELVIERGADHFEPVEPPPDGDITFAEAKQTTAGRMVLGGNVEARVLEGPSIDAVDKATRAAFDGGKEHMILKTTSGPIGPVSPQIAANYHRMLDVWEELSPM